jgi:hypothetical protein
MKKFFSVFFIFFVSLFLIDTNCLHAGDKGCCNPPEQGPPGPPGPTGATGPTGPAGPAGIARYAEIYVTGGSGSQEIGSTDPVKVNQFTDNGNYSGMTANAGENKITVTTAGIYEIAASISFSGTNNAWFTGIIHINGSPVPHLKFKRRLGANGDVGSAGISGIADIGAGQDVDFRVITDSGTALFNMEEANLNVRSIGGN